MPTAINIKLNSRARGVNGFVWSLFC